MSRPVNIEDNLELYLDPIEIKVRERFLEIVKKHGNGLWAFDELSWEIYINHIDDYEALTEEEKYTLNMYMKSFRSLYK